jgi:hypothetical protein
MPPKFPCGTCGKAAKTGSILCNFCNMWHHATPNCVNPNFTKEQVDLLITMAESGCWSCQKCTGIMKRINIKMGELDKKLTQVTQEVSDVKKTQAEQGKSITTIECSVKTLSDKVDQNSSNVKTSVLAEVKNRESKKNNVIILGLTEPESIGAESKEILFAKEDEKLNKLFSDMSIDPEIMSSCIVYKKRLGKKDGTKPRPLLLCLNEHTVKNRILDSARRLKVSRPEIVIRPDLTATQRQEDQELIKEVRAANDKSPKDESGDFRWRVVGPPGMLRKVMTRDLAKWQEEERKRQQRTEKKVDMPTQRTEKKVDMPTTRQSEQGTSQTVRELSDIAEKDEEEEEEGED